MCRSAGPLVLSPRYSPLPDMMDILCEAVKKLWQSTLGLASLEARRSSECRYTGGRPAHGPEQCLQSILLIWGCTLGITPDQVTEPGIGPVLSRPSAGRSTLLCCTSHHE